MNGKGMESLVVSMGRLMRLPIWLNHPRETTTCSIPLELLYVLYTLFLN
jgi:hypothetical protein